jgi:hypothetical protein
MKGVDEFLLHTVGGHDLPSGRVVHLNSENQRAVRPEDVAGLFAHCPEDLGNVFFFENLSRR